MLSSPSMGTILRGRHGSFQAPVTLKNISREKNIRMERLQKNGFKNANLVARKASRRKLYMASNHYFNTRFSLVTFGRYS